MNKPVFVETSVGLINLSLVTRMMEGPDDVRVWFSGDGNGDVKIPEREWPSVRDKMISEGLLC